MDAERRSPRRRAVASPRPTCVAAAGSSPRSIRAVPSQMQSRAAVQSATGPAAAAAIGQSAATGQIALATLLVVGFALHNATEGFGITAPLAGDTDGDGTPRQPSWGLLLTLGLIGG